MSKKKLLVGIPGFKNSDDMFGVTGNYMQFASSYGDVRILMPHEDLVPVDLLILPGGLDVSPTKYGQQPSYKTTNHDVFKEFFFDQKLQLYIDAGIPIFGICLGYQMLNVKLGGTLTQHVFNHQSNERWKAVHDLEFIVDPKAELKVNSHHHQAILEGVDLAPNLNSVARSTDKDTVKGKRIIEAFMHETLPIAGVQWHPEELYDWLSNALIEQITK